VFLAIQQLLGLRGNSSIVVSTCTITPTTQDIFDKSTALFQQVGSIRIPVANAFMRLAEMDRQAVTCAESSAADKIAEPICSTSERWLVTLMMFFVGSLYLLISIICLFLQMGYSFFSNLPFDSINSSNSDYRITCLGAISKQGPKLVRMANLTAFVLLIALLIILQAGRVCFGSFQRTHNCIGFQDDCAYNQIKNCQFYFSSTCRAVSGISYKSYTIADCLDSDVYTRFSGRFDARVLHEDNTLACWMLHFDCQNGDTNIFRVLLPADANFLAASSSAFSPFYGNKQANDPLAGFLYCKHPSRTIIDETVASELGQTICSQTFAWSTASCDLTATKVYQYNSPFVIADSENDAYAMYRTDLSMSTLTASVQECTSVISSSLPAYYTEATECEQSGSYLSRFSFLSTFLMIFLAGLILCIGIMLRANLQIETWCYDPPVENENSIWRIMRATGPG